MLFLVTWTEKSSTEEQAARSLQLLANWQPPDGVVFQGFYARIDGGGFSIVEADSAAGLLETTAPWEIFLDFDISPIVAMEEAGQIFAYHYLPISYGRGEQ